MKASEQCFHVVLYKVILTIGCDSIFVKYNLEYFPVSSLTTCKGESVNNSENG